jgi:hypothetical protein
MDAPRGNSFKHFCHDQLMEEKPDALTGQY